jgi:enoyl-CoA hydratase/carnithine racemase
MTSATAATDDIVTERTASVLRVTLNRPARKNAMTASMYTRLAQILVSAALDESTRAVLLHGAGDAFCAGNDVQDFLKNPPGPGESPQSHLMHALVDFDKPLVAAVQGAAIGGGTTMLLHADFVYAGESARFQMPFINLALVPEFGSSFLLPARLGHITAAELILLGVPFGARRAADMGLVTQVVAEQDLLATAMDTAQKLAAKPAGALRASKTLLKRAFREQTRAAMQAENEVFSVQVRSQDATEAIGAFLQKRRPDFNRTPQSTEGKAHA